MARSAGPIPVQECSAMTGARATRSGTNSRARSDVPSAPGTVMAWAGMGIARGVSSAAITGYDHRGRTGDKRQQQGEDGFHQAFRSPSSSRFLFGKPQR